MKLSLSEILKLASEQESPEAIIEYLRSKDGAALRIILKYAYDDTIKWLLPEGPAPYTPTIAIDQEGFLYSEARRLYLYIEGGNPNLSQMRREILFVQLLETVDKNDAELLIAIKDKKLPYETITPEIVDQAFPGLLNKKIENSKIEKIPLDISKKDSKMDNVKSGKKAGISEETREKLRQKKLEYWKRKKGNI